MGYKDKIQSLALARKRLLEADMQLDKIMNTNPDITYARGVIKGCEELVNTLQDDIINSMKEEGVGRVANDTHTVVMATKKSVRIVNPIALESFFQKQNVSAKSYMKPDVSMMKKLAGEFIKKECVPDGIENDTTEYIRIISKTKLI